MGACTQTIAAPPSETFGWVLSQIGKKLQQPMPEERYEFVTVNYAGEEELRCMGECVDSLRLGGGGVSPGGDSSAIPSIHSVTLRQIRMADEPDRASSRRSAGAARTSFRSRTAGTASSASTGAARRAPRSPRRAGAPRSSRPPSRSRTRRTRRASASCARTSSRPRPPTWAGRSRRVGTRVCRNRVQRHFNIA